MLIQSPGLNTCWNAFAALTIFTIGLDAPTQFLDMVLIILTSPSMPRANYPFTIAMPMSMFSFVQNPPKDRFAVNTAWSQLVLVIPGAVTQSTTGHK